MNKSTYQIDYPRYSDYKGATYNYERNSEEKPSKPSLPLVLRDHETFAPWRKDVNVPFDLFLTPKEIVNTHPKTPFVKIKSLLQEQRDTVIKTRPRVYMAPACCLDDVPDPEMRKLLVYQTYTTEWRKAEKEVTENFKPTGSCIAEIGLKDNVKLEIDLYKPLDEKFRIKGKQWDDEQPRGYTDPTKEFWINRDLQECGACVDSLEDIPSEGTKRTIESLIEVEKLRYAHDKVCPTYTGYRPLLPLGIPLSKPHISSVHPLLTTYQTITKRHRFNVH